MRKLFRNQQLILFLIQGSFFGNGLCVSKDQKSTYYHTGDRIGYCGKCTLCKYFFCRFSINQNIQYRSHYNPSDDMSNYVCDCKYCCFCFTKITFLNVQLSGECSYNHTDKCRCDHPAPPRDSTTGFHPRTDPPVYDR